MSQNRFYSSVATKTTTTGGISAGTATLPVVATTGFPASTPYTLILERDTINEEVVTVTGVSSLNLTITRGVDGTTAVSHSLGATVEHGVSAQDFTEPQQHIGTASGVHGATGNVVGTGNAATTTTTQAIGDAGTVGVDTTFAREDHKHAMPSFSGSGAAATIARSDHTHPVGGTHWSESVAPPVGSDGAWYSALNGTGSAYTGPGVASGNSELKSGTTSGNTASLARAIGTTGASFPWTASETTLSLTMRGAAKTLSSAGASDYIFFGFGVGNNDPNAQQNGVWLTIRGDGSIGYLKRVASASTTGTLAAAATVALGVVHDFRVDVPIAGGTATFYLDGASIGTVASVPVPVLGWTVLMQVQNIAVAANTTLTVHLASLATS